jgi:prepilin-type N-terminal cleavage/methylation domain-containing protein
LSIDAVFIPMKVSSTESHSTVAAAREGAGRGAPLPSGSRVRHGSGGFTMVELLVTMGIIAILLSLLLGGLSMGRFKARVAHCTSNYRQWGVAVTLYAGDDGKGRLPAFPLELGKFRGYRELVPWFGSLQMGTNLGAYGLDVPLWYCPARGSDRMQLAQEKFRANTGRTMGTVADLTRFWVSETRHFAGLDFNWFVPRPFVDSDEVYPSPRVVTASDDLGWPSRLEDPAGATHPVLTDFAMGTWNEARTRLNGNGTMHQWPGRWARNLNLLFVDGRVETRHPRQIRWRMELSSPDTVIPY